LCHPYYIQEPLNLYILSETFYMVCQLKIHRSNVYRRAFKGASITKICCFFPPLDPKKVIRHYVNCIYKISKCKEALQWDYHLQMVCLHTISNAVGNKQSNMHKVCITQHLILPKVEPVPRPRSLKQKEKSGYWKLDITKAVTLHSVKISSRRKTLACIYFQGTSLTTFWIVEPRSKSLNLNVLFNECTHSGYPKACHMRFWVQQQSHYPKSLRSVR